MRRRPRHCYKGRNSEREGEEQNSRGAAHRSAHRELALAYRRRRGRERRGEPLRARGLLAATLALALVALG